MVNYTLGDFLIRLKNASMASRTEFSVKETKLNLAMAKCLKEEKILSEVKVSKGTLTVEIARAHKSPVLKDLRLISKPGLRIYKDVSELKKRKERSSILILSTPKGIMSHKNAIKKLVGGEVLVEVW